MTMHSLYTSAHGHVARPCSQLPAAVRFTAHPKHAILGTVCSRRNSKHKMVASLKDMQIKPLAPSQLQQLEQHPHAADDSSTSSLHIPTVAEWGSDEFLMAGCEPDAAPLRVAVLVSGGVDSSLALQLVKSAGHIPTAFYLQIWFQEDFRNFWDSCPWEEDLDYARKVCDALDVPLVVVPLTQEYWDRVVAHSVAEIKAGRTPNPDMLCNSRVKFGAFVEYLQREHSDSFDRIASGHYAHIQRQQQQQQVLSTAAAAGAGTTDLQLQERLHSHEQASSSSSSASSSSSSASSSSSSSETLDTAIAAAGVRLCLTPDAVKDQTYFLGNLSAAQLASCMFPLGVFTKPQVRALAAAAGLATSGRKDSQGICFLGKVKFGEFVKEHLGEWPGPLVEEDSGKVVGVHDGYWFYTVGQRGGIKLPGGPWYVTAKDMTHNVVYVSRAYYEQDKRRDAFFCGPFNWLSDLRPCAAKPLMVKVRHGPNMYGCKLRLGAEDYIMGLAGNTGRVAAAAAAAAAAGEVGGSSSSRSGDVAGAANCSSSSSGGEIVAQQTGSVTGDGVYGLVVLSENDQGLAPGQYAVFYQDGVCLGSAQMLGSVARWLPID